MRNLQWESDEIRAAEFRAATAFLRAHPAPLNQAQRVDNDNNLLSYVDPLTKKNIHLTYRFFIDTQGCVYAKASAAFAQGSYGRITIAETEDGQKWALKKTSTDESNQRKQANLIIGIQNEAHIALKMKLATRSIWSEHSHTLITKYLGISLSQYLYENSINPSSESRLNLAIKAVSAVYDFHNLGYVHLDLKPSNFTVDDKGEVHLIDFGFSESKDGAIHNMKGSPLYLLPVKDCRDFQAIKKRDIDVFALLRVLHMPSEILYLDMCTHALKKHNASRNPSNTNEYFYILLDDHLRGFPELNAFLKNINISDGMLSENANIPHISTLYLILLFTKYKIANLAKHVPYITHTLIVNYLRKLENTHDSNEGLLCLQLLFKYNFAKYASSDRANSEHLSNTVKAILHSPPEFIHFVKSLSNHTSNENVDGDEYTSYFLTILISLGKYFFHHKHSPQNAVTYFYQTFIFSLKLINASNLYTKDRALKIASNLEEFEKHTRLLRINNALNRKRISDILENMEDAYLCLNTLDHFSLYDNSHIELAFSNLKSIVNYINFLKKLAILTKESIQIIFTKTQLAILCLDLLLKNESFITDLTNVTRNLLIALKNKQEWITILDNYGALNEIYFQLIIKHQEEIKICLSLLKTLKLLNKNNISIILVNSTIFIKYIYILQNTNLLNQKNTQMLINKLSYAKKCLTIFDKFNLNLGEFIGVLLTCFEDFVPCIEILKNYRDLDKTSLKKILSDLTYFTNQMRELLYLDHNNHYHYFSCILNNESNCRNAAGILLSDLLSKLHMDILDDHVKRFACKKLYTALSDENTYDTLVSIIRVTTHRSWFLSSRNLDNAKLKLGHYYNRLNDIRLLLGISDINWYEIFEATSGKNSLVKTENTYNHFKKEMSEANSLHGSCLTNTFFSNPIKQNGTDNKNSNPLESAPEVVPG